MSPHRIDRLAPLFGLGVLLATACGGPDNTGYRQRQTPTTAPAAQAPTPAVQLGQATDGNAPGIPELRGEIVQTGSGLRYIDQRPGDGAAASRGQGVSVHYTGWLTDGRKFDSSVDRGQPITFNIGTGAVIQGWDEGVGSMRVGGRRRLIIPPDLGYGAGGSPPSIPPNATLIFDVELVSVG